MKIDRDTGAVLAGPFETVYVYEAPVRLWHWVMATCMVVLAITGYLIGSPPPSVGGEASEHYVFGTIRFAHFTAAFVFAIMFVVRVYWAFVGNRWSRQIFVPPLWKVKWWREMIEVQKYYAFMKEEGTAYVGHNPMAQAAMFFMYVLGTIFMIFTGFALYSEGLGRGSWADRLFGWVIPLFGQSQDVHTWHRLGMWYLVLFTMIHLYLVFREDIMSGATIISTMVNGLRIFKKRS